MISISISGRNGKITSAETITSGSVGMTVAFTFSSDWNSYTKIASFRGSGKQLDMTLTQNNDTWQCNIPAEVLATAGTHLMIGAYGTSGNGNVAVPTVWVDAGTIELGAVPSGASPTPTTPSLIDQLLAGDTLPINKGGTGATSVAAARAAFGLGNTTGALPIANGGTGATTAAAARTALGLGDSFMYYRVGYDDWGTTINEVTSHYYGTALITYLGNDRYRLQMGGILETDSSDNNTFGIIPASKIRAQINANFSKAYTSIDGADGMWNSDPSLTLSQKGFGLVTTTHGNPITHIGLGRVYNTSGTIGAWSYQTLYAEGGRYVDIDMIVRLS